MKIANFNNNRVLLRGGLGFLFLILIAILIAGCDNVITGNTEASIGPSDGETLEENEPPEIAGLVADPSIVVVGGTSNVTVFAFDSESNFLIYSWSATSGLISGSTSSITYLAPSTVPPGGTDVIAVSVSDGNLSTEASVGITIVSTTSLSISPSSVSVPSGSTQQFIASGSSSSGGSLPVSPSWTVTGGIGSIDSSGLFSATVVGSGTVIALSGSFEASAVVTVTSGSASTLTKVSGDIQSSTVGATLADPMVVKVTDTSGNPVSGYPVTFEVATGSGTLSTASVSTSSNEIVSAAVAGSLSTTSASTDSNGFASTVLTLGDTAGTNSDSVKATALGLTGFPLTFTASANAGPAASIAATSGNNQVGAAGTTLPNPFVATVTDSFGNPVSGFTVTFNITSGGGTLSASSATTGTDGTAPTTLTLGSTAGTTTVNAVGASLLGSPAAFSAIGAAGVGFKIEKTSGDGQTGVSVSPLANPLVVTVRDVNNNPVSGVTVAFSVVMGSGVVSTTSVATSANGQASTSLTLGTEIGIDTHKVGASASGLTGSPVTVTFTATATVGSAFKIEKTSGDNQTGFQSTVLIKPLVVTVRDANNNPVPGVNVAFSKTLGSGSVSPTSVVTGISGQASTTFTLGSEVGTNAHTVAASATDSGGSPLVSSPVTFTASVPNLVLVAGIEGATANEEFGFSVASGQLNDDSFSDVIVGAPKFNSQAGIVRTFFGSAATFDTTSDGDLLGYIPGSSDVNFEFGYSVASVDFDSVGGFFDVIGGEPYNNVSAGGVAHIYQGGAGGSLNTVINWTVPGPIANEHLGWSVAGGKINAGANGDVVAGAPDNNTVGPNSGRVTISYGTSIGLDTSITGEATGDTFGWSVAAGAVDPDGDDDVLVGAPLNDAGGANAGRAYVFATDGVGSQFPASMTASTSADLTITGEAVGDQLGYSIATGDINTDGAKDIIIGAPLRSGGTGTVYIFFGGSGNYTSGTFSASSADVIINGEVGNDNFGWSVASAGDVNGDGDDDLIVGAPLNDTGGNDRGRVYIFFGKTTFPGTFSASSADVIITGEDDNGEFGFAVSTAGNVDDDPGPRDEVVIGAPKFDGSAGTDSGKIYIYRVTP